MSQAFCTRCGASVDPSSRFCSKCGTGLPASGPSVMPPPAPSTLSPAEMPPPPPGYRLSVNGDVLTISWAWARCFSFAVAPVFVGWTALLIWMLVSSSADRMPQGWIGLAVVTLLVDYFVLGGMINHTYVDVSRDGVTERFGPLFFPGSQRVPRAEISDVSFYSRFDPLPDGTLWKCEVLIHHPTSGGALVLRKGLSEPEARFVTAALKRGLGLSVS